MKERPILFSAPMVHALLAGTKTQTRRVVKPQPHAGVRRSPFVSSGIEDGHGRELCCRHGHPEDLLRVKEAAWMWCERKPNGKTATGRDKWFYVPMRTAPIHYAADRPSKPATDVVSPDTGNHWGWRLKIGRFLPAWASRITLEITGVRVERLRDISEADAGSEGCDFLLPQYERWDGDPDLFRKLYRVLWEQINGPGSWDANPWVWVVEFRRIAP